MNDPDPDSVIDDYSDAERLRDIRAVWLADLPVDVAFLVIGKIAFNNYKSGG